MPGEGPVRSIGGWQQPGGNKSANSLLLARGPMWTAWLGTLPREELDVEQDAPGQTTGVSGSDQKYDFR